MDLTHKCIIMCYAAPPCLNSREKELLFKSNQIGSDVVLAVISKLQYLQILNCDHRFLRRIALVETNDGNDDVPDGGIWALDKEKFNIVLAKKKLLRSLSKKLCLDLLAMNYDSLRRPLMSGLFASLYLYNHLNIIENNMLTDNITKQANLWFMKYHSQSIGLTEDYFVEQVGKSDCSSVVQTQVDQTLDDGANGSSVVEMVIAKISNIFDSGHRLLRRIAYVETNDGTSGVPPGGIWAVDECKLSVVLTAPELVELHVKIDQELDIGLECSPLSKPLVSGLAARLYLHYLEIVKNVTIPSAADIEQQAQYWHNYYYSGEELTAEYFEERVTELENEEGR